MPTSHAITKNDANVEVKAFLEIREEAMDADVFQNLSQKARYYYESNILSFVFYKDQLDALFAAVQANAIRIYYAADASGNPTLVIYPCYISADETQVENKDAPSGPTGAQYPKFRPTTYNKSNFDIGND